MLAYRLLLREARARCYGIDARLVFEIDAGT